MMRDLLVSPVVKAFFSANTRTCRNLLMDCRVSEAGNTILISTAGSGERAHALILRQEILRQAAKVSGVSWAAIAAGSEIWCLVRVPDDFSFESREKAPPPKPEYIVLAEALINGLKRGQNA